MPNPERRAKTAYGPTESWRGAKGRKLPRRECEDVVFHAGDHRHRPAWPARRSKWSRGRVAALAIFSSALMAFTIQVPTAAASGTGGGLGGGFGTDNNTSSPPPYYIPASAFPAPANLTTTGLVTQVATAPLPGAVAGYAVAYGATNASGSTLWVDQVLYSSSDAYAIAKNGSCGPSCGQLPLSWNPAINVSSFGSPVGALRVVSSSSELVVAASSGGDTYLFSSGTPYTSWAALGPTVPGTLEGLAADPEDVAVATGVPGAVCATLLSATGTEVGQSTIYPLGSNATGVVGAGVVLTPYGATYLESVAFTVSGSDEVQFASSTNGISFSAPSVVGAFSTATSSPALSPAGRTALSWTGGVPGQLSLTSIDSDLFLLYTTNQSGQTVPATEVSGNNGTSWSGPYVTSPVNGSIVNPALSAGPTGMIYATWEEPDFGSGATDEATYSADGLPAAPPQTILPASLNGSSPITPSTIAVDGFGRPLLFWGIGPANGTSGAVAYTGGYLAPSDALNATENVVSNTLSSPDFSGVGSSSSVSSLITNVSSLVSQAETNISAGNVCNAENDTGTYLYQNLTHLALSASPGPPCAASLHPRTSTSPLKASSGIEAPNTFYATYVDWALESEGVPVSTSPLSAETDVYPYSGLAISAALPALTTGSETVSSQTETVSVSPTPYSPTAYELATSAQIPVWYGFAIGPRCGPPPNLERYSLYYTTTVSTTWVNVSVNNGPIHSFTATGSYPSVWINDLPAYQTFGWSATFAAVTKEVEQINDACTDSSTNQTVSPVSYGPRTIPAITLSGTFATSLSVTYGAGLLTAALNGNRTAARVSLAFNNTLPAAIQSSLSNTSGTQTWASPVFSVPETYSFAALSAVGQTYTYSETSTSRPGNSTSPGSPSFVYGSSGTGPAESSGLWCQFTLSAAGPRVWTNNSTAGTWPYSNINATAVEVSWYSNQDVTGFYSYHETGSSIVNPITGIVPVRVGPGNWSYSVEVYGLQPLASYGGTYGVSWTNGCLVEEDQLSGQVPHLPSDPGFSTADSFALEEQDQSFDSITGTGGGINLTWSTPPKLQGLAILGGYVTVQNPSNKSWKVLIPISPSEIVPGTIGKKTVNILSLDPALTPGTKYKATLTVNYTGQAPQSGSHPFTYHLDSSGDGLTDLEKTAGWNVSYSPSGSVVFSKNQSLHSNLLRSNVIIDPKVTLTTNGYSIVAANEFLNYGTVVTGAVDYTQNPSWVNFPSSYGGSGGGGYGVVDSSGDYLCCGSGGSTRGSGGGESTSIGHNGGSGGMPGQPSHLSSAVIQAWWNASMRNYLSGAAGGLTQAGWGWLGGKAGWGLYIQAKTIVAGSIVTAGSAGSVYGGICSSGQNAVGGGGGGGSVLLAYELLSLGGGYTPPAAFNASGGPAYGCPGDASSGRGGAGQLIPYGFSTPPVPPPPPPTFAGSTMVVKHVHASVEVREKVGRTSKTLPVFSTNGLANDYLEKAYGLDPKTVDTAGSDMLDLWNLTFDLGQVPLSQATSIPGIVAWSEVNTSTWDPWGPAGDPSGWGGNVTCTAAACPDNSSSVASLLWPASQLSILLNLSGVKYDFKQGNYLRGVVGTCPATARSICGTDRILTVWGKLSWGANPLAGSTPGNGIPDGARVNPVGGTDLQVTVTKWSATNSSSFRTGDGVAAYIDGASSGTPEYGNFTNQTNVSSGTTSFAGSFVVTFPVDPTEQYAQLNFSLVQNTGANGGNSCQSPLRTPLYQIDLENPSPQSSVTVWSNSSGANYMLQFHWQVLPVQAKAPTWIYIPTGNATLSALPGGLQRYSGEQNFIELVLNDTASPGLSPYVSGLPYSNNTSSGGSYAFRLDSGANNLLVPRGVFLSSPLGRSVLNLSGSSTPNVAIKRANGNGPLQSQWQSEGNGALWFNRTTGAGGYTKGSAGFVEVAANTSTVNSTNSSLTGGVPGNPRLEKGYTSLAIQAIYAANESTTTELEGLLAGLLLNTTGNFTGWLLNATTQLPTLGLLPAVMNGLANASYVNDGGWRAPVSTAIVPPPHHNWWDFGADWSWFWNSVSGVFTGTISLVWNAAIAAAAFIGDLGRAEVRFAFNSFSQVASTLERVAAAIASALNVFVQWLIDYIVKPLLNAALEPFYQADNSYATSLNTTSTSMYVQVNSSGSVSPSAAGAFGTSFEGTLFLLGLGIGATVEIVLAILTPLDFGAELVIGLILQAIVIGTIAASHGFGGVAAGMSAAAVYSVEGAANLTHLIPAVLNSIDWKTFALAFSLAASVVSLTLASNLVRDDNENPGLITVIFAFGIMALGLDISSLIGHAPLLEVLAIILGAIGVALGVIHVVRSTAFIQIAAAIATGLAVAGLGAAIYHAEA